MNKRICHSPLYGSGFVIGFLFLFQTLLCHAEHTGHFDLTGHAHHHKGHEEHSHDHQEQPDPSHPGESPAHNHDGHTHELAALTQSPQALQTTLSSPPDYPRTEDSRPDDPFTKIDYPPRLL